LKSSSISIALDCNPRGILLSLQYSRTPFANTAG
jgi:hypothetical protein